MRDEEHEGMSLEASELFCPRCGVAVPVQKRLVLVIPGKGDLFHYICRECGDTLAKNEFDDNILS